MGEKRGVEEGRDAQRMDGLGLREWKMPSGNEVSQGRVPEVLDSQIFVRRWGGGKTAHRD